MKKIILLLFLVMSFSVLLAEIDVYHNPPVSIQAGDIIELEIEFRNGFEETEKVNIFYREAGQQIYNEKEMMQGMASNPKFSVELDEIVNFSTALEYYFQIIANDGSVRTLREMQPELNPFVVQIEELKKPVSDFVLLSPDKMFSDTGKDFVIAISTYAIQQEITDVMFMFDGKDVSDQVKKYSNMIVYNVKGARPGDHRFQLKVNLADGTELTSPVWKNEVKMKLVELPLDISGRGVFNSYLRNISYEDADDEQKRANFLFTLNGQKNWFKFDSKLYLSSLETHKAQAVNRYALRLQVPHFSLRLGDHTPNYGSFIMNGKNIRGFHTDFNYKYFRLLASSGSLKRAIDGEEDNGVYTSGTFKRSSLGARIEVGSKRGFLCGITFAKNKDDMDSLDDEYWLEDPDDPESEAMENPEDNIMVGTDMNLALFKQRVMIGAEAAMSYFNSNIKDGAMSLDSINAEFDTDIDLPIDPADFSDIIVINKFIEPFKPGLSNLAYRLYARAFFLNNLLNVSYHAIGSSYNSLSTNSLQKDQQMITVSDNLRLLNNKLSLNASFSLSSDNVYDTKDVKTTTTQYSLQTLYRPRSEMYFRIGYTSNNTQDDLDDPQQDVDNGNLQMGVGYFVENISFAPTDFSVSFSNSNNIDNANDAYEYKKNNVVLTAVSDYEDLPMETTVSYALALNNDEVMEQESSFNSIYLKSELEFLRETLKPFIDYRFTSYGGDIDAQSAHMFNLGSQYNFTPQTFLSTNIGYKAYQNSDDDALNYNDFSWRLKITQKF